jgi:hypothetical protein
MLAPHLVSGYILDLDVTVRNSEVLSILVGPSLGFNPSWIAMVGPTTWSQTLRLHIRSRLMVWMAPPLGLRLSGYILDLDVMVWNSEVLSILAWASLGFGSLANWTK